MNLKQNAWMYLFFASVLLWVGTVTFSCESGPKVDTTKVTEVVNDVMTKKAEPCKTDPDSFQLKPIVAQSRIERYVNYAKKFPPVNTKKLTPGELVNPDVRYFQLPRCELNDMLAKVGEGADIKAHLAIKDVEINNVWVEEIVLVFEDTGAVDSTSTYYYDFVDPCPKDCK